MTGLARLMVVQTTLFLREPSAFFFTLIFPALLLVIFGIVFGNEPMIAWGVDAGYIDLQVPALAAIIIGTVGLIGIPVTTSSAREAQILRRYRATPLSPLALITADVMVNFAMSLVGMVILIGLGKALFGLRFGGSWAVVIVMFSFAAFAFFALGYLIASLAPTPRVAQTVGMAAFFPMMFLSGAALPRQLMPAKVLVVSDLLPLTHVVKTLQTSWMGDPLSTRATELAWLAGFLVVGTLLSVRLFRWE